MNETRFCLIIKDNHLSQRVLLAKLRVQTMSQVSCHSLLIVWKASLSQSDKNVRWKIINYINTNLDICHLFHKSIDTIKHMNAPLPSQTAARDTSHAWSPWCSSCRIPWPCRSCCLILLWSYKANAICRGGIGYG